MKQPHFFSLLSAGALLSVRTALAINAYDAAILSDHPVGYWPLQETNGTAVADITGNGNIGTMFITTDAPGGNQQHSLFDTNNAGFTLGAPGLLPAFPDQTSIYFNTVNAPGAEIAVPYTTNLDTAQFSGEVWVKVPTFPVGYVGTLSGQTNNMGSIAIMGPSSGGGNGTQTGWLLDLQSDTIANSATPNPNAGRIDAWIGKGSGWTTTTPPSQTAPNRNGQTVHVVITYDGVNLKHYQNGVLQATVAGTYRTQASGGHTLMPFVMGSYQQSYFNASTPAAAGLQRSRFFTGGMSHVAVYSNALSAGQILNHYLLATLGSALPPSIGSQPVGGTNYVGYTRTLSVAAGGTAPLSYQWSKDGSPILGATNASLVLSGLVLTNGGSYRVAITNLLGSTNSDAVSVGVLSLPANPYQAMIISQFPRAYYPLNETNGTDAPDLILTGDNDATYANAPTLGVPGASSFLGPAVAMDGLTNGIFVNNAGAMNIVSNITLEAWILPQDPFNSTFQNVVAHGPAVDGNPSKTADILGIDDSGNYYIKRYQQTVFPTDVGAFAPVPPEDQGQWVHLVGTADGAGWHLYRNGVEIGALVDTNGAVPANGGWAIAARNANSSPNNVRDPFLNGSINNVAIYDYALKPGTILNHYQVGLTGVTSPVTNTMAIQQTDSGPVVTWQYGSLQAADSLSGPWTDIVGASPYTLDPTNSALYFRAILRY